MEARIFRKLGLKNTHWLESGTSFPGPHAKAYYEGVFKEGHEVSELYDISWINSAGCVCSTPRDMQWYYKAMVGGELLSDSLQKIRLTDFDGPSAGSNYGLCIIRKGSFYGHTSGIPGYTSAMYYSPAKKAGLILIFNAQLDGCYPDQFIHRFIQILY